MNDEIMAELRLVKDELSKEAKSDMHAYCMKISAEACNKGFRMSGKTPSKSKKSAQRVTKRNTSVAG